MTTLSDVLAKIETIRALGSVTTRTPPRAEFSKTLHPNYLAHLQRCYEAERAQAPDPDSERFRTLLQSVGVRYRGCTFDTFVATTPEQKKVLAAVREYSDDMANRLKQGQGLVLFGPSGTGKDHLMVALMREATLTHRKVVKWLNGVSLFAMFRDAMDSRESEEKLVKRLSAPHVLVLSDPQPAMGVLTPYQSQVLFQVVDERYRNCSPTWVTMNAANGAEAESKISTATVDRMRDGALALFCNWPSYRKAIS